jgi:hypothetical protein
MYEDSPKEIRVFSTKYRDCQHVSKHGKVMVIIGKGGVRDEQASVNKGHNFKGVLA